MKPFFNDKNSGIREKITLVENGELIDDDLQVAETFNAFFSNSVRDDLQNKSYLYHPTFTIMFPTIRL